jgi:hypothetical protein
VKSAARAAVLIGTCLCAAAVPAAGQIILTPFVGKTFAATNTLTDASPLPPTGTADKQTWMVGGSATWLSGNVLGAELDFGYAPHFFRSNQLLLRTSGNNIVSLTGQALLTVPIGITRESLRPYITGGMGILHAGADDRASIATLDRNLLAVSYGGGAIGFVNQRAGVRFDLRHIRSTSRAANPATGETEPRLGFWRATVGVAIRY